MLKDLKLCIAIFYLKHFETSFILNISSKSEAWHLHRGMSAHGMQMECMFHLPPNVHENLATATVTSTSALIKAEDNRGPKIRAHRTSASLQDSWHLCVRFKHRRATSEELFLNPVQVIFEPSLWPFKHTRMVPHHRLPCP